MRRDVRLPPISEAPWPSPAGTLGAQHSLTQHTHLTAKEHAMMWLVWTLVVIAAVAAAWELILASRRGMFPGE